MDILSLLAISFIAIFSPLFVLILFFYQKKRNVHKDTEKAISSLANKNNGSSNEPEYKQLINDILKDCFETKAEKTLPKEKDSDWAVIEKETFSFKTERRELYPILAGSSRNDDKSSVYKEVETPKLLSFPLFLLKHNLDSEWEGIGEINYSDALNDKSNKGMSGKLWGRETQGYIYFKVFDGNGDLLHCMVLNKTQKEYSIRYTCLPNEIKQKIEQICVRVAESTVFLKKRNQKEKEVIVNEVKNNEPLFHTVKEKLSDLLQYQHFMTDEEVHLLTKTLPDDMAKFEETYHNIPFTDSDELEKYRTKAEDKIRNKIREIQENISKRQLKELKKDTMVILERR